MNNIRERKHRLNSSLYLGRVIVSFTACIVERKSVFREIATFHSFSELLMGSLARWNCESHIHLLMPDHCHFLIQGNDDSSDLLGFMKDFKQRSGYWFYKNLPDIKWQKDFYDHILRKDEDVNKQVRYILGNPVRKGLIDNWKAYPFKGSTMYDFTEW